MNQERMLLHSNTQFSFAPKICLETAIQTLHFRSKIGYFVDYWKISKATYKNKISR